MDLITEFIRSGQKGKQTGGIGLEVEHFLLHKKTGLPMPYAMIEDLFEQIRSEYDTDVFENGHRIALENAQTLVTLEPGCQLEVSFFYTSDLDAIESAYHKAMAPIIAFVEKQGYEVVYSGGIPTVDVDAFDRIEKERYHLMEQYFQKSGTRGKEMMKGTASVHVSIDYADEADYVKKYRMANILHPIFAFLCFHTPQYAGKVNTDVLLRDSIWAHTDKDRCRIVDDLFSDQFGYQSYANYVEKTPLILMHTKEDEFISVGDETCQEVAKTYGYSQEAIAHYLSMVFPNIRTKNFIEIRSADSMPIEYAMAYCALLKGLFYHLEAVDRYSTYAHSIDEILEASRNIRNDGWKAHVYGHTMQDLAQQLLIDAKASLSIADAKRLKLLEELVQEQKHIGDVCR